MQKPNDSCPKCGDRTWDGPVYVPAVGGVWSASGFWTQIEKEDSLQFTCNLCRYVRYVAPLDRQQATGSAKIPDGGRYVTTGPELSYVDRYMKKP